VPAVKGQAMAAHEPRESGMSVTYAMSPGTDHTAAATYHKLITTTRGQMEVSRNVQVVWPSMIIYAACLCREAARSLNYS
jgi:hypothetical protein